MKVAGLGEWFLGKIQNCGRRFTLDWLECLEWGRSSNNFIGSLQSLVLYEAKQVRPKNCTKMPWNLTFFVQFAYFTIRLKKILFFRALFRQLFKKLRELFWKISSNLWKALIQEQGFYFAHIRDGLFFFWSGQIRNIEQSGPQPDLDIWWRLPHLQNGAHAEKHEGRSLPGSLLRLEVSFPQTTLRAVTLDNEKSGM